MRGIFGVCFLAVLGVSGSLFGATGLTITNITSSGMTVSWGGASPEFRVIYKLGSVPTSRTDGVLIFEGVGTSAPVTGLTQNTRYFIAVYDKASGSATYSATAVTTSVITGAAASTTLVSSLGSQNDVPWERRSSPTRQGKFIFVDSSGNLSLFDGTSVSIVQAKGAFGNDPNTVLTLGTAADPAHVIAAWRRDSAYVSTDGGTPFTINAANPVTPGTPMNAEMITIDGGCVFAVYRAVDPNNAADRRNAFRVDPSNGTTIALTNNTTVNGVIHMSSSGCKAAWAFDDGTGSNKLQYYNGSTVTTLDSNIFLDPTISQGRIVYAKLVAAGNTEIFLYDTNLPSPSPVQLTNDPTKTNDSPLTDGRHAAWVRRNLNFTGPEIVLNGGLLLTSGNFQALDGPVVPPFHLDRGQILWRDTGGVMHHETSSSSTTVATGGATATSIPWLADGRVVFFDNTTSPKKIYRFVGELPNDSEQPAAPMFLRATPGSGSVTLRWDAILGATSYNVYYATQPGLTKANYAALGGGKISGVTGSPYSVTGIASNAPYYFIVSAVDPGGEGPASRQASTVLLGSTNWTSVGGLSAMEIAAVAGDLTSASVAYASGGNNTYKSNDSGQTWSVLAGGIQGANVRALAANAGTVFATAGAIYRSTNSGVSWTSVASSTSDQMQQAVAIDPAIPTTIVAGDFQLPSYAGPENDSHIIRSDDNGATWFHLPQYAPAGSLVAYSFAFDPDRSSNLYAGGNGTPNVAISIAGGAGWANKSLPASGSPRGFVYTVAVDSQNSQTVYAGTQASFGGGSTPGIWKSTNSGTTWTKLVTGLPASTAVHSIVIDPADSNLLHLGTEAGYYYSTNAGASWTLLNGGLPTSDAQHINQLAMTGSHRLIAATWAGLYLLNLGAAALPTVSSANPSSGAVSGGTSVTISGANFQSGATVTFGGSVATNVALVNSATITATTPAHAAGPVDIVVYNPDGQTGTKTAGFTYSASPPMITTQPASQTITPGQTATLNVVATGAAPLTYQWYVGTSGTTSNPIFGATSSSYTTPALTSTTSYWVRISNADGATDSGTATITVDPRRRLGQTMSI